MRAFLSERERTRDPVARYALLSKSLPVSFARLQVLTVFPPVYKLVIANESTASGKEMRTTCRCYLCCQPATVCSTLGLAFCSKTPSRRQAIFT